MRPLLGTYAEIEIEADEDGARLQAALTEGFRAIASVQALMSYYRPDSDLSRINRAKAGQWLDLHPLTLRVLRMSNELFQVSGGVFDIRCASLLVEKGILPGLAGRAFGGQKVTGEPPLEVSETSARKTGPWILDLGGIAKGFAVDQAVERIQGRLAGRSSRGVVNAGGDLRAWGRPSRLLAIRIFGRESCSWTRQITVKSGAVATSYARKHATQPPGLAAAAQIRMPAGLPIQGPKTATVLASKGVWADALTKIVLTAPRAVAAKCLASYGAKGLVFGPRGELERVIA